MRQELGIPAPENNKEDVDWYQLAAEKGHPQAQFMLGSMHEQGQGFQRNYKEAVKWWRLAAEQGDVYAQNFLAYSYWNGRGVLKDNVYAYMWYNISAYGGLEEAGEARDIIVNQMTPSQIAEAQKMAREWMRRHQ